MCVFELGGVLRSKDNKAFFFLCVSVPEKMLYICVRYIDNDVSQDN